MNKGRKKERNNYVVICSSLTFSDDNEESSSNRKKPVSNYSSSSSFTSQNSSKSVWIILLVLGSSVLITMYGETMLLPAIPDIIREFNIPYNTVSWILTAYLISGAIMTPIAGKLSDIYGRKKVILSIMVIYIIGISLGGLSTNFPFLIVARIIQGVGISMFPIAFGIIRDKFPPERLAIGVGMFSSMFAGGSVVGLALGGSIIQSFGWRFTFLSIIPLAVILWFTIRRRIYDDNQYTLQRTVTDSIQQQDANSTNNNDMSANPITNRKDAIRSKELIDIKGAITLALAIASFLIVLSYMQTGGDISSNSSTSNDINSFETIGLFMILGTISIALFIIVEKKVKSPLIDFKLLADKVILPSNLLLVFSFLAMFMVYQTIPVLVRSPYPSGFGGNAITTANIQLPFMIVFLLFAPSSGFIISRLGNIKPTIAGTIISTIGFFSVLLFHSTETLTSVTLAIIATGLSLVQVGGFDIVLQSTPRQFAGVSLGTTVLLNLIGGAIGPAIAGVYMQADRVLIKGINSHFPSQQSYSLIFLTATLFSLVSILLILTTKMKIEHLQKKKNN